MSRRFVASLLLLFVLPFTASAQSLPTRWGKTLDKDNVHAEYPRPQLVRDVWQNLNGPWQYAISPAESQAPSEDQYSGQILVPFPIESELSGVKKRVEPGSVLWYRRSWTVPADWSRDRIRLNFGAVDWHATVFVNGKQVGEHRGGYDPFSFDVTESLRPGTQELVVRVSDPTDTGPQPRGKQVHRPHGIWYTPTTGIWQTVWAEPIPAQSITSATFESDIDGPAVTARIAAKADPAAKLRLTILDGNRRIAQQTIAAATTQNQSDGSIVFVHRVANSDLKLWSPDSPQLYDVKLELLQQDRVADLASTYFALRSIRLGKDAAGVTRILLNNKFLFQYGLLDQGFWPDGLYTAPSDAALRFDLEVTKKLGFNMVRKHVKVEPARWYRHCDELGLLVWQDMPSGDKYIGERDPDIQRTPESQSQFETEWTEILKDFGHFPCIVMWVPFNEGWGQFDTARIAELTRKLDPTRLVNSASGWTDRGVGDVHDIHLYPGPGMPPLSETRAAVLGEFGGLGLPLENHTWQDKNNWGYRSFTSREALNDSYAQLLTRLRLLVSQGLSAAVYTQTTDVEIEVNGILTYDREVLKLDEARAIDLHRKLHLPPPTVTTVVASSREQPQIWSYTTENPGEDWHQPSYDDSTWKKGPGGFGEPSTPGSAVRTKWKSQNIWLRREIEIPDGDFTNLSLLIHHDEDTEVYLDGKQIARTTGYTVDYVVVPLASSAANSIRPGRHVLAVHCRQTGGGQYIDVGLVDSKEPN